jgi:hypothetical protein
MEVHLKKYLPEFLGVGLSFLLLNLWYLSSLAVDNAVVPEYYGYVLRLISPAIGALVGAFLVFKLNTDKEIKKEKKEEAAKLNRALIHMGIQLNVIGNIKNVLKRYKNIHEQAFIMPAEKNYNDNITFDIGEISLILSDQPQLLLELSVEQDGYIQTLESLKTRHEFFLKELHPLMIKLDLMNRKVNTIELEDDLPEHIFKAAYQAVQIVNSNVISTEKGLENVFGKLKAACHDKFPDVKFADFLETET